MTQLANGLSDVGKHAESLSVDEAKLSILRRHGATKYDDDMLTAQGNIACTYELLGRREEALPLRREVYSGRLKRNGAEDEETIREGSNYALVLLELRHFEEAK